MVGKGVDGKCLIKTENDFKTFYYKNCNNNINDICLLLSFINTKIKNILNNLLLVYHFIKFNIVVKCSSVKDVNEIQNRALKTRNIDLLLETKVSSVLDIIKLLTSVLKI